MKTIKLLSLSLFVFGGMLLTSCKKEGCTNDKADNYDAEAKVSDKSCVYTVDVVFWFEEIEAVGLSAAEINKLTFLLNKESIGSASIDKYSEEAPTCNKGGNKFSTELKKAPYEPFNYTVEDEDGNQLIEGIVQLDTDSCRVIKLENFNY